MKQIRQRLMIMNRIKFKTKTFGSSLERKNDEDANIDDKRRTLLFMMQMMIRITARNELLRTLDCGKKCSKNSKLNHPWSD